MAHAVRFTCRRRVCDSPTAEAHTPCPAQVRAQLQLLIEGIEGTGDIGKVDGEALPGGGCVLRIAQAVTLTHRPAEEGMQEHVVLEWQAGTAADMVADAVVAVILQVRRKPAQGCDQCTTVCVPRQGRSHQQCGGRKSGGGWRWSRAPTRRCWRRSRS